MTSAETTLKVKPYQHTLILHALASLMEEYQELIEDPVVKGEDKAEARGEVMHISDLLRDIR